MKVYFIGIGGIGVSALAQYYLAKGHEVSGSDLVASEITDFLKRPKNGCPGIKINIGQKAENIKQDTDLIIYSPAVKTDNFEYKKAKKLGIKIQSYPEALGELTKNHFTIAVSGSHGKSTTTAIIALVLIKAGLDPTVIIGTKVKEFSGQGGPVLGEGNNFKDGKSNILVIEACEYDSSFLHYSPKIIVVTNIDKEHLDYFKTFANVKKAFLKFITRLPADGFLVFNNDNEFIPRFEQPKFKTTGYTLEQPEAKKIKKLLKVPGLHNVSNALSALQVARILEIPDEITFNAFSEFKGTWRRFEIKNGFVGKKKIIIISDYAHHPNEILATLKAAREKYPKKFIACVFQPHQYQRTHYLFNDFIKVFRSALIDEFIITDIYDVAGRE
ncbi:MAG: UDP-N-acetylmuramate--L-alanine ligase, partial [bacterium]|nr:UDP-N-acetylmuramate--L-alanine ligase [bacterium]